MDMEPVVAPLMAEEALALGNLIGVVRECIVDTAGMDIHILAQMLHGNAGAFNMPARIANAPRRIPLQCLILKLTLGKPQNKVILIALVAILFYAFPDAYIQIFFIVVVEDIVLIQCGSIKVDIAACKISVTFFQQSLDHVDILVDTVGCRLYYIGALDIQLLTVGKESIGIEPGDIHNRLILPLGTLEHLVFTGVGIGCQMAHVCNIHNALDIIAAVAQCLLQHVFHDIGTQVANMGIVVHRRTTGIHLDNVGVIGNKQFLLVRQGIIQIHR